MTIVGEAFVRIVPDASSFGSSLRQQMATATSGVGPRVQTQFAQMGTESGASFARATTGQLGGVGQKVGTDLGPRLERQFGSAGHRAGRALGSNVERGVTASGFPANLTRLVENGGLLAGTRLGSTFASGFATASGVAAVAIAAFGLNAAAEFQQTRIAFEGILGSAQRAQGFLAQLRDFAATTPFEFPELASASKNLLAVGFNAKDVIPIMTRLGNVAATLGVGGEAINGVVRALGQMKGKGKASVEELNQISESIPGFSAVKAIAEALGISTAAAFKQMESGAITADAAVEAILKGMEKFPGAAGAMERQSKTLNGVISTLTDTLRDGLINAIEPLLPAMAAGLAGIPPLLERTLGPLTASFVKIAKEAEPLAILLVPFGKALQGLVPVISSFAAGLDVIGSALGALPGPLGAAAIGAGILAVAGNALAVGLYTAVGAVETLTKSLIKNPYFLAAAAIVALGAAFLALREKADGSIKVAEKLGTALFDAESSTTIFAAGITNAAQGLEKFIASSIKAGEADRLRAFLNSTGTSVQEFTEQITGSDEAFAKFTTAQFDAMRAAGLHKAAVIALTEAAGDQREAFALQATVQAENAIATGVLTRTQKNAIVEQNRFADGSVNLAGVLNDINGILVAGVEAQNAATLSMSETKTMMRDLAIELASGEISASDAAGKLELLGLQGEEATKQLALLTANAALLTAEQDRQALSTISTSQAYGTLAAAIATGQISQVDARIALEEMGLSAEGAEQAFGDLQDQITTFVDNAVSQLPSVADAMNAFQSALSSDQSQFESDVERGKELQAELAAAGGAASDELRAKIDENNAEIRASFERLVESASPQKFTDQLLANAAQVASFTANLQTLIENDLGPLAGQIAQLGPEAAGSLAAALAGDIPKAQQANAAAKLAESFNTSYKKFLEENIGPLALTGEAAGRAVGTGIAKGIIDELLVQIPALREYGIGAGLEIDAGAAEGANKTTITDTMKARLAQHIPEFRGLGIPVGTNVIEGAKTGVESGDLATPIEQAIRRNSGRVRGAGRDLGGAAGEGIVEGIREQFDPVGDAILAITQHGVAVAKGAWKVTSPSQVFAEIGSQVGAGLALGITGSASEVGTATALLASEATTSVADALEGVQFSPEFTPTISPTVEPIELPPIDAPTVEIVPAVAPVAPILLQTVFGPITAPAIPPVTIDGSVIAAAPTFDPIVLSGALGDIGAPVVPPVVIDGTVKASLPTFEPVVLSGAMAPVAPPTFEPIVFSGALDTIPAPTFDPVVLDGSVIVPPPIVDPVALTGNLAPFDVPVPPPISATLAPLAAPVVPPISTSFAPIVAPSIPSLVATIDPVPSQDVDQAFAAVGAAGARAGVTAAQGLADGISSFTPTIDTSRFEGPAADAATALTRGVTQAIEPTRLALDELVEVRTPGQGLVEGFTGAFETIRDDAETLRRFLAGLGGTKLAFDQPPSSITIAEAAQSVQVARPEDRANAERQQEEVRNRGLLDGAQFTFNEKVDPLHVASEIAWRLL